MKASIVLALYFTFNRENQALSTRLSTRFNLYRPRGDYGVFTGCLGGVQVVL